MFKNCAKAAWELQVAFPKPPTGKTVLEVFEKPFVTPMHFTTTVQSYERAWARRLREVHGNFINIWLK